MAFHKHNTKDYINIALFYLMSKSSYEEISVTDICQKANVSRMSFYRYYNNKEDIFINYCDERFEDFVNIINEKNINDVYSFLLAVFNYVHKYARQVTILKRAGKEHLLVEKFTGYGSYLAGRWNLSGTDNLVFNRLVAAFLAGGIANVLSMWFDLNINLQAKELADLAYSIFGTVVNDNINKKNSNTQLANLNKEK